jgi:hypothetical protein
MRREYPAYPEEAFEATGGDILDQRVLAVWAKEAKEKGPKATVRMIAREQPDGKLITSVEEDDRGGCIEIYQWPEAGQKYVMGVDCSQGTSDGDWQVGLVLNVETGDQVAEFRAKMDPDIAIDQIEWLALFYNNAFTGIETSGGYGWPFVRHIHDRGLVNLYERIAYDRTTRKRMKKPGWDTNVRTRPMMVSETKTMVRDETCRLFSSATIDECRLLHENDQGKVEARAGFHDDGWVAYAIAGILRNEALGITSISKADKAASKDKFLSMLNRRQAQIDKYQEDRFSKIAVRDVAKPVFAHSGKRPRVDGRRSWVSREPTCASHVGRCTSRTNASPTTTTAGSVGSVSRACWRGCGRTGMNWKKPMKTSCRIH